MGGSPWLAKFWNINEVFVNSIVLYCEWIRGWNSKIKIILVPYKYLNCPHPTLPPLMVCELETRSSVAGSIPSQGMCQVLKQDTFLSQCLSPQRRWTNWYCHGYYYPSIDFKQNSNPWDRGEWCYYSVEQILHWAQVKSAKTFSTKVPK